MADSRVVKIYIAVDSTIESACRHDHISSLYEQSSKAVGDDVFVRVTAGSKHIVGMYGNTAKADADKLVADLRAALAREDLLVHYHHSQPVPYPLKIQIIDLMQSSSPVVTLSKTPASSIDKCEVHDFDALLQTKLALAQIGVDPKREDEDEKRREEYLEVVERDVEQFKEFCSAYHLTDTSAIKTVTPSGNAYRLTYYDPSVERRVQCSVGDVTIVLGEHSMPVLDEAHERKLRSDRKPCAYYAKSLRKGIYAPILYK